MNVRFKTKKMGKNLKTVKEHLKMLPLQKRLQATEEIRKNAFPSFKETMNYKSDSKNFLMGLFTFHYSRKGADYWFKINKKYYGK